MNFPLQLLAGTLYIVMIGSAVMVVFGALGGLLERGPKGRAFIGWLTSLAILAVSVLLLLFLGFPWPWA
jgi:hypothetical protein